jgi:small-conductance mechanosensitive channel
VFKQRSRPDLAAMLAGAARWGVIGLGLLIVATIIFPSISPADLLSTLGIGSIAIGFAFKDILQNWLAGLLILLRQPFRQGDQIIVGKHEGTVEHIEARATLIKTYDGRRVIIPNSAVYTDAVTVNTAFPLRRSQYDVGIGYSDDIDLACEIIVEAVRGVEGVADDPSPEAFAWELAGSTVDIRVRWWTHSKRSEVVHVQGRVIRAVKKALSEAGIDLPFPTSIVLLHDQTEDADGDRRRQREGWPAGSNPPAPRHLNEIAVAQESGSGLSESMTRSARRRT